MSNNQRPRSTRAQLVTAVCAALCAVGLAAGALVAIVGVQVAGAVIGGIGSYGDDVLKSLSVPAAETMCLNYTTTVLELDAAGLDHDAIVGVIDNALPVADAAPDELAEMRELSLANEEVCGPVRNVLDAAGR